MRSALLQHCSRSLQGGADSSSAPFLQSCVHGVVQAIFVYASVEWERQRESERERERAGEERAREREGESSCLISG